MAQAEPGTMVFVGRSGRTYVKDVYLSDVNAALIRWDAGDGAGAATPDHWRPIEDVVLRDFSVVTGTTDTTKMKTLRNGIATGDVLRYAIHLTTLNNRPRLNIGFPAGIDIQASMIT